MSESFDLLSEPWIPCLKLDGSPVELGLRDTLLRSHDLREVAGESPLVTAAIYRLLLAVLHRVYGPADEDAWLRLWEAGRWQPALLDAYLAHWASRFDLFGRRPFLQRPDPRVKPKSVASLVPEVASGHNPTLFDHHVEDRGLALTAPIAARGLVVSMAFGLSGRSGTEENFTAAPCTRGVVLLAEGDNLFETLCLNLTRYPWQEEESADRPAWEVDDPTLPARDRPLGMLDLLTWPNRNILLFPERSSGRLVVSQMTMAPSVRLQDDVLDPTMCYRVDKKAGWRALALKEARALWRDVTVMLGATAASQPARAVKWLGELVSWGYLPRERRLRFIALGMANDQAKIHFVRGERLPLPLAYLADKALTDVIVEALELAEGVSRQLWGATRTLAILALEPQADLDEARRPAPEDVAALTGQWAVERHYWSRLELPFKEMMAALPDDPLRERTRWRETLRSAGWAALESVAGSLEDDLRRIKAVVRARDQLAAGLARVLGTRGG